MSVTKSALTGAALAATVFTLTTMTQASAATQCGTASWYALNSKTANGEQLNVNGMTAAHPSLPFGTVVKVTNERNGRSVNLRINDRGPFVGGRIIDVTRGAAQQLGFINAGTTRVCVTVSGRGAAAAAPSRTSSRVAGQARGCSAGRCVNRAVSDLR